MDLSMLLSQAEMSYSKMNFYKNPKNGKKNNNQQLIVQVFEQNLDLISSFLSQKDIFQLRLLCRGVGYLFIVRDLWSGMKVQVADKKLQDLDDYEFIEEEPKQISKEDKKIRIHSLKKNMANSISKKTPRQASNIKQKKISMTVIDNELNPFQKTQIGFKRLLKSNNPSLIKTSTKLKQQKNIDIEQNISIQRLPELLEIPKQYSIDDLIINPRDQWVKNMHRANNLITVVRRWNLFHQRFWTYVSRQECQLIVLMKKMIKLDGCLLSYKTTLDQQPVNMIVKIIQESAPKNALIEDQLNKLGKEFLSNHKQIKILIENKQTEQLITALHECYQKISQKLNKSQLQPTAWVQGLNIIEEAYDNILSKISHDKLKLNLIKSITNVFKQLLNQHLNKEILFEQKINFKSINLKFIIQNSQFCQLSFQIIYSLITKITQSQESSTPKPQSTSTIKLNESSLNFSKKLKPMQKSNENKMTLTLSKFNHSKENNKSSKSQKTLFGILWNISKYFDKLQKQLVLKEKKKKQQQKVHLIKNFMENESNLFNQTIQLICTQQNQDSYLKSLSNIEEYYKEFKIKIEKLKDQMVKTNI